MDIMPPLASFPSPGHHLLPYRFSLRLLPSNSPEFPSQGLLRGAQPKKVPEIKCKYLTKYHGLPLGSPLLASHPSLDRAPPQHSHKKVLPETQLSDIVPLLAGFSLESRPCSIPEHSVSPCFGHAHSTLDSRWPGTLWAPKMRSCSSCAWLLGLCSCSFAFQGCPAQLPWTGSAPLSSHLGWALCPHAPPPSTPQLWLFLCSGYAICISVSLSNS